MRLRRRKIPCIGWTGPCDIHGPFHGCIRPDNHTGNHLCQCGEKLKSARSRTAA